MGGGADRKTKGAMVLYPTIKANWRPHLSADAFLEAVPPLPRDAFSKKQDGFSKKHFLGCFGPALMGYVSWLDL